MAKSDENGSLLGNLKSMRQEIADKLIEDIEVPRWYENKGVKIVVQCHPLEHSIIRSKLRAVEKAKGDKGEAEVNAHADLLVKACTGIYGEVEGQRYSLRPGDENGDWTTFDPDLAENLGLSSPVSAIQTCRALFFTDGDLIMAANRLIEFSGYSTQQVDEEFAGE